MLFRLFCCISWCVTVISCASESEVEDDLFKTSFDIIQIDSTSYLLNFIIDLDTNNYFVSPKSTGHHQRLQFSIAPSEGIALVGELKESPVAQFRFDSISKKSGHYIDVTTTFSQQLETKYDNVFMTKGLIWFEIRPACQPYEITFEIKHQSNELTIENIEIKTSDYPNFEDNKRLDNGPSFN